MYYLCFCIQPLTVLGHVIQNFNKLSLKNYPFIKSITIFLSNIFSYIVKSVRNIFRLKLQKATKNISAEVAYFLKELQYILCYMCTMVILESVETAQLYRWSMEVHHHVFLKKTFAKCFVIQILWICRMSV